MVSQLSHQLHISISDAHSLESQLLHFRPSSLLMYQGKRWETALKCLGPCNLRESWRKLPVWAQPKLDSYLGE